MSLSLLIKEKSYQDISHEKKFLANIPQKKNDIQAWCGLHVQKKRNPPA